MKKYFILLLFPLFIKAQVVLIDPGHGGAEGGAEIKVGNKYINEKDYTLKFAKILKEQIKDRYRTYLTRENDRFVSLNQRAKMADTVKADLIISLHFNSSSYPSAAGIETYYLDNHMDKAVKKVEREENILPGEEDFVINHILVDLAIKLTSSNSQKLASYIHQQSVESLGPFQIKDRGHKPGLFYVLALSKRPGVLIEGGFLSNQKERKMITESEDYLKAYAKGIAKGLDLYFSNL